MLQLPVISLFSGAGGLDLGFAEYLPNEVARLKGARGSAGGPFTIGLAVDREPSAIETYNANHATRSGLPPAARQGDLAKSTATDLLSWWDERNGRDSARPVGIIGGPPCQSFSVSNVYPRDDDSRVQLIYAYADLVEDLHRNVGLSFFLFENVAGLTHERNQPHFHGLLRRLRFGEARDGADERFAIYSAELDAQGFGVPQTRRRRFIVGINRTQHQGAFDFPPPDGGPAPTVRDTIFSLPPSVPYERGRSGGDHHPNHWHMAPKSWRFRNGNLQEGQVSGRSFRVLRWDRQSWTVAYGNREVHVHPSGKRRLSVLEAMLLQGFPESYVLKGTLSQQIRLVSDTVPPPLAYALADSIYRAIAGLPTKSGQSAAQAPVEDHLGMTSDGKE